MRLRAQVTQLDLGGSDDEFEEDAGADDAWQPREGSDGSDGEDADGGDAHAGEPAHAGRDEAPRRLSHNDLARALQQLPAAHTAPAVAVPESLTQEWACNGGFDVPTLVAPGAGVPEALGMRLPPELGVSAAVSATDVLPRLLQQLPPHTPVPIIDVTTQAESEPLPLTDFVSYFTSARRERLLNVVSLSLAGTPLEAQLCAPRVVRDADLVARAWPAGRGDSPAVQLYALASPAGCVTDWHLDFGGSSVWYYILAGSKVFALAPPTKPNMRAYVTWASSSRQMRQFLGDALQDVHKYTVHAGELLLIPGGWPHAVFTPEDSCVVGGNFVHAAGLGLQALVWRIEDRLRVEASFRYPNFKALCWYAALRFCDSLPAAADEGSAVARVERAGAKRLFIKLQKAVAKAKTAAADSGGEEEDDEGMAEEDEEAGDEDEEDEEEPPMAPKGDGLQHILNALTAAEEEQAVAPGSSAAPEPAEPAAAPPAAGAAALVASEPDAPAADPGAGAAPQAADAPAAAPVPEAGIKAEDAAPAHANSAPPPPADAAPSGPPLSPRETAELVKLCAQLNAWLAQSGDDDAAAGVPADIVAPRSLLARLQARLRAAGHAVQQVADEFDDTVEDITAGGTRMRFRLRKRSVEDAVLEPALPLPAELRDDVPRARKAERAKPAKAAAAKPPKAAPKPPAGVRDRLAKKLKFSSRR